MKKGKIALSGIIAIAVLAAVLAIALSSVSADIPPSKTYPANATWFDPEDIRVPGYCDSKWVDIWINTSVPTMGGRITFDYTYCCANLTDNVTQWVGNTTNWPTYIDANMMPGRVIIGFGNMAGISGLVHIGAIKIHCCNTSSCCITNLKWNTTDPTWYSYITGVTNINWVNGTFRCGEPSIEVNKTVWNGTEWVDLIVDAEKDDEYRFRIEVHGFCCDYFPINITDTLSDSLSYNNSAWIYPPGMPGGMSSEPSQIGPNQYQWVSPFPLPKCQIFAIEFNATVIDYGTDCNVANATGWCDEGGIWVSGEDDACINAPAPKPDLIVESIKPNCGYLFGNESNEICAKITNLGADANASNACFVLSGGYSEIVGVPALAAGTNTTVCATDPTDRNAGDSVTITVTADCKGEIDESNETNNVTVQSETVMNNGYKGKRYTGGEDINTWKTFELQGDLLYSLGDSYYLSSSATKGYPHWTTYNASWDASNLPVPGTATVKEARLYVTYTWDKKGVMPTYVSMNFNGNPQTLDAYYSDRKMHGSSNYPYGMLAYNVTDDFSTGGNVANLTNIYPGGGNVSMRGMLLIVIYADDSEPERKIYINEEFDLLYGGSYKCTTPEEATAYAPFGAIDPSAINSATLITVAPGAGPNEGDLSFNGQIIGTNVWNFVGTGSPTPQIGINETDVTSYLNATDNEANFQSSGDWMEASNAFLILEYDTTPPAKITDLATSSPTRSSITLTWTAPGDDVTVGTASEYDIRYSTSMITDDNWGSATRCTGEPTPSVARSSETFTVTGLSSGTTYYFAIKTADDAMNWALLSNIASGTTESVRRRGGGGGAAPRDSDGDGYSDIDEMLAGTDLNDPNDYPGALAVTPTPTPTPTPVVTPTAPPTAPPTAAVTPTPTPTPEEPGFEAVFATAGLLAVAYLVLRRRRNT